MMASANSISDPILSPSEEAERVAALDELISMRGSLKEMYDRFGGVDAVIRDRHGLDVGDNEE